MRLLIADDEVEITRALRTVLERQNYAVDTAENGKEALDSILSGNYDGVILDVMMPEMDGLQVLRQMREKGCRIPVLLLTARGSLDHRVEGLDAGADDFLPKPFAITELLARVRAMLRRSETYVAEVLTVENLQLNCGTCQLICGQASCRLNNKEFQLMECFMRHPGMLFSSDRLMEKIWGWDGEAEVNVVWVYISNLRKKLAALDSPVEIRAARGLGYTLEVRSD